VNEFVLRVVPSSFLPVGEYPVPYSFTGDMSYNAAHNHTSLLNVVPLAVPKVTLYPMSKTVSAGDPVAFTAAATGSADMTVQWQVGTDGGLRFGNVTRNVSAQSTSFSFYVNMSANGYEYHTVFANSAGTASTSAAKLTVEGDAVTVFLHQASPGKLRNRFHVLS
jgi:hypothetical protein